jgi:hypothetical protein
MTLCWADKTALALFTVACGFLLFLGMGSHAGTPEWWEAGAELAFLHIFPKVILPIWIVLRVLDLVFGGPARRSGRRKFVERVPDFEGAMRMRREYDEQRRLRGY